MLGYENYETIQAIYKKGNEQINSPEDIKKALGEILTKLPGPQVLVLDAVTSHFNTLIANTKTEESDEAYITKLSLSIGRRESERAPICALPVLIERAR